MFFELLAFEIRTRLWRLSSLVYFLVFFGIGFFISIAIGGAFPGGHISLGASGKLCLNSPFSIHQIIAMGGYLGLLIIAPIFGQSINKDFERKFSQILFATPLKKSTYFFVRYVGATISSVLILTSIGLGIFIATLMPFLDQTMIGKNEAMAYVMPYLTDIIPNTMIFGAMFLAIVSIAKRMTPVYLASVIIFMGWFIAKTLSNSLGNHNVTSLLDPLGLEAAVWLTRYWSAYEQATRTIPLTDVFLYNRILWGCIGGVILLFSYITFDPFKLPKEKKSDTGDDAPAKVSHLSQIKLPQVKMNPHSPSVLWHLTMSELKQAFSNVHFRMILLCGVLFVFATARNVGKVYGTETLPVTYNVLEIIGGLFGLFVAILSTFCAGELSWKERESHFADLVDSKPVSSLYLYLSQLFTLFAVQFILAILVMLSCMVVQTSMGYYKYEFDVYFQNIFIFSLIQWLFLDVLSLFIHTVAKRKYIGHSMLIFYYALLPSIKAMGFDHRLYMIGDFPSSEYSDMNGFGTSAYPFSVFCAYWGSYGLICALLTLGLWPRGVEQDYRSRLKEFRRRITPAYRNCLVASIGGFVAAGLFIYYNTNILNTYQTTAQQEKDRADYEIQYKKYEGIPQLELVSANIAVDLFPERQSMKSSGRLTYVNKTGVPIKTLLLHKSGQLKEKKLQWSIPAKLVVDDSRMQAKVFEFEKPVKPQEKIVLDFECLREPVGFSNGDFSKDLVQNGSLIYNSSICPLVGYVSSAEISEEKTRKKYGLGKRRRMPDINDEKSRQRTYISSEGCWIDFEATISTAPDQIALAPGNLVKEWSANGRRYFHYKMDRPMLDFYAIVSGRYEVARDKWNGVDIEVYHHPGHKYNVARMMKAAKATLEYCSNNFSPYQHKHVRIVEFPRYKKLAQSFAGMIPFSEGIGFIARVSPDDPKSIDYPYYVTAHEVAHQWWGHQVVGCNVQGSTMLSESLAQYTALMVQEKEFGKDQMKRFLSYELDAYLSGRRTEAEMELPLAFNENQEYIHYNKGSLVFYTLKDNLGEATVNQVLREYVHDIAYQQPPFTRSIELVERFRKVAPPDKKYLIADLFENITFYVIQCDAVNCDRVGKNQWDVQITGSCRKFRLDGTGNGTEVPMNDYIDVGLYDEKGRIYDLSRHQLKSGHVEVHVKTAIHPARAAFDPLDKLIRTTAGSFFVKSEMAKK